jgi:hypothetical protein
VENIIILEAAVALILSVEELIEKEFGIEWSCQMFLFKR